MRHMQTIFGHLTIIFAVVFLTLTVINVFNPAMQFLDSVTTRVFLVLFCFSALSLGIYTVMDNRHREEARHNRAVHFAVMRKNGGSPTRPPTRDD